VEQDMTFSKGGVCGKFLKWRGEKRDSEFNFMKVTGREREGKRVQRGVNIAFALHNLYGMSGKIRIIITSTYFGSPQLATFSRRVCSSFD
jgi:hypothetical protein